MAKLVRVPRKVTQAVITSPSNLPSCNERIISYVAAMNKTTQRQVEEVLNFVGRYTKDVMEDGIMETVMLPQFGKIRPKVHEIQGRTLAISEKAVGKHEIMRAIRQAKQLEEWNKSKI